MKILSFEQKALPPDLPQESSFPFKMIDVMIDPTWRVLCVRRRQGELLSAIPLSYHEYAAMMVFYEHYPHYAPDTTFVDEGITDHIFRKLRLKMRAMGFVAIERIRTTGYYLFEESSSSTSAEVESCMLTFSS